MCDPTTILDAPLPTDAGTSGLLSSTAADAAASGADAGTSGLLSSTPVDAAAAGTSGLDAAIAGIPLQSATATGVPIVDQSIAPLAIAPNAPTVGAAPIGTAGSAPQASIAPPPGAGPGADVTVPQALDSTAADAFKTDPGFSPQAASKAAGDSAFGQSGIKDTGSDSFLGGALDKAGSFVGKNPGALLGAGILGFEALNPKTIPGANTAAGNINATADQLNQQGQQLQSFINTGQLPPGIAGGIKQATEAAKATIRSQYAARGMSGSSAEMQDLANADNAAATQGATIAMNLLQTGLKETDMATALYDEILKQSLTNDAALSSSIGNFAAALAGGGGQGLRTQNTAA